MHRYYFAPIESGDFLQISPSVTFLCLQRLSAATASTITGGVLESSNPIYLSSAIFTGMLSLMFPLFWKTNFRPVASDTVLAMPSFPGISRTACDGPSTSYVVDDGLAELHNRHFLQHFALLCRTAGRCRQCHCSTSRSSWSAGLPLGPRCSSLHLVHLFLFT